MEDKPLPDRRFHQLFEERVASHPQAIAIRYRDCEWSYAELNRRANRVAHQLLSGGLQGEDVVCVVSERTPAWAAAVLGVFKAGGVYLPIDPDYPLARVAALIRRSGCRRVLHTDSTSELVAAAAATVQWPVARYSVTPADPTREDDPGVEIGLRQAAYVYFTSGSTGVPKGALCEHLGLLNHLLSKVDVLELTREDIIVQNAPVAFDISLWQLAAVLLVGGQVNIVPGEAVLDVRGFVDHIVGAGATVLQVVPSYLDIMLAELEVQPRPLGRLRRVSVTGEAISTALVERWFRRFPTIPLVNAYGATEASDDTTHAVLLTPPATQLVPVGRPIANVRVYVLDEHLRRVPLGAIGEIAFAGVCVGRGYLNDPERTREVFLDDPFVPGDRLYRSGDFGRWLPDGNLEFVGRRDSQVKIRGMRIELGEVEYRIQRVDGVGRATVVVHETAHGKSLVAFYTADQASPSLAPGQLLDILRATVPAPLVPVACHRLDALPLTENGKTDLRALAALADTAGTGALDAPGPPPATAAERRLATAWAEVLGRPLDTLATTDDFFALGGDSLAALRLVVKLDRIVSLTDLLRHPVLGDLAGLLDGPRRRADDGLVQRLAGQEVPAGALLCVPDAGGNAVNFQPLAGILAARGVAVFAVELPGHDVADPQPLADVADVAHRVAVDMLGRRLPPLAVWGQGAGAATAHAIARELERTGGTVRRVLVAAPVVSRAADVESAIAAVDRLTDGDVKASLAVHAGYVELDELQDERAHVVGAAYRHDGVAGARYLTTVFADPPRYRIRAPLTVVVATDEPGAADGVGEWLGLADEVTSVVVPGGGHHLHRVDPARCADLVLRHAVPAEAVGP